MMCVTWDTGILWNVLLGNEVFPFPPSNSYQFPTSGLLFWLLGGWTDIVERANCYTTKIIFLVTVPLELVAESVCGLCPSERYCGLPALILFAVVSPRWSALQLACSSPQLALVPGALSSILSPMSHPASTLSSLFRVMSKHPYLLEVWHGLSDLCQCENRLTGFSLFRGLSLQCLIQIFAFSFIYWLFRGFFKGLWQYYWKLLKFE